MCSSSGKAAARAAGQARNDEEERQRKLDTGMQSISDAFGTKAGFTDQFYNQRTKDYKAYYRPQVQQQFNDAREQLNFALARTGLGRSSAGAKEFGDLTQARGLRLQEVLSNAKDYAQQTRKNVEAAKSNVIAQLYATNNPEAAAKAAITSADLAQRQQNTFSPIGDLFSGVSGLASTSKAATDYGGPGLFPSVFNRGYSGTAGSVSGKGSSRVIGGGG